MYNTLCVIYVLFCIIFSPSNFRSNLNIIYEITISRVVKHPRGTLAYIFIDILMFCNLMFNTSRLIQCFLVNIHTYICTKYYFSLSLG